VDNFNQQVFRACIKKFRSSKTLNFIEWIDKNKEAISKIKKEKKFVEIAGEHYCSRNSNRALNREMDTRACVSYVQVPLFPLPK
jgi:hypothetical protein